MKFEPSLAAAAVAAALVSASPAQAALIPDGSVSISGLFNPSVHFGATNSFTANNGSTFQVSGDGGFAGVGGGGGTMNGALDFLSMIGGTVDEHLTDFLVFGDGNEGEFHFSVDSVKTLALVNSGISSTVSLYLLGTTWDPSLGLDATATSLTLSFNRTGGSAWSASASLAVPPAPDSPVPEPASWAMMVSGFGLLGATMRTGRRRVRGVAFA